VLATTTTVRVLDPDREATKATLCSHARSWDRDQQIEDPSHIEALTEHKRAAKQHRAIDRVHAALPHSRALLVAIAERGGNLGSATWALSKLLDTEHAAPLDAAIEQALARGTPHLGAVRHLLDRARKDRGEPPAVEPHLPADPRLEGLVVRPHPLSTYDRLQRMTDDNEDE
jgi:predicted Zn-dependent protease